MQNHTDAQFNLLTADENYYIAKQSFKEANQTTSLMPHKANCQALYTLRHTDPPKYQ